MEYRKMIQADQRLAICQILEQDPDYSHNEHVIKRALAFLGHSISSDLVRTRLAWLEEQDLVRIDRESAAPVWVVTLTSRGEDAALGRARIEGVARPRPD